MPSTPLPPANALLLREMVGHVAILTLTCLEMRSSLRTKVARSLKTRLPPMRLCAPD